MSDQVNRQDMVLFQTSFALQHPFKHSNCGLCIVLVKRNPCKEFTALYSSAIIPELKNSRERGGVGALR